MYSAPMNVGIINARICDPSRSLDAEGDIWIKDGVISERPANQSGFQIIDGRDIVVTPGFIDLHVHFREPGGEASETISTGSAAAARGGFTQVVTMPNTHPPTDTPDRIHEISNLARGCGKVAVLPSACATRSRRGLSLTDLEALKDAGARAFTDDGSAVADPALMLGLLNKSKELGIPVMQHAVDPAIAGPGVIRDCELAKTLNLPIFKPEAEYLLVERDISLLEKTGGILHFQHISTKQTVELLRCGKRQNLPVSAEVTPHHLALSTADIVRNDANYKMNPPLGTPEDRIHILEALSDGTITCLATDHAPHSAESKSQGFAASSFGVIGLESAASVTFEHLVAAGHISLLKWAGLWTTGPANVLAIPEPSLSMGSVANISVFQKIHPRPFTLNDFAGKSANTPFLGMLKQLDPIMTVCMGRITWMQRSVA